MANNNPHGHISQPTQNPSWNPLQIPSFIPRQPQLAHMSNERPMVRSPLAWHAPAPPDSIYNFMSANHKNLDHQMNPLIPPFVRGPSPFDSMDLSLQSSRSSSSPLNKSGVHLGMPQHEYGTHKQAQHQQQQQQQHQSHQQQQPPQMQHTQNSYPIPHSQQQHASMSAPAPQHPHGSMQSVAAAPPPSSSPAAAASAAKYLNANGNDCETMLPPASAASSASSSGSSATASANVGSGAPTGSTVQHYMRENEARLNENYSKMSQINRSYDSELQSKSMQKPVELVNKDCNYTTMMASNKMSTHQQQVSPKKHSSSPLRNYHQQQQSAYNNPPPTLKHNGPHTPPTPQSPVMHQPPHQPSTSSATSNAGQQQQQQMQQHSPAMLGNSGIMDYNQLHLQQQQQQQQQNSYAQQHHQQHQQQHQQHIPPHLQQQHLHYTHHHHRQQHHSQTHMHSQSQHAAQQQQQHHQQPQQQPPAPSQQHLQQQHHSAMQQQQPQQHQHPQLTNLTQLENYRSPRNDERKVQEAIADKPIHAVLSTPTSPATYKPTTTATTSCLPDSAESPDPISSNDDESLDSYSNSSGSRIRRKRKSNAIVTVVRGSSNESENDELSGKERLKKEELIALENTRNSSPKTSPESPRKQESNSPTSSFHRAAPPTVEQIGRTSPTTTTIIQPANSLDTAATLIVPLSTHLPRVAEDNSQHEFATHYETKEQTLENGQQSTAAEATDDVETIDKIAEMIAKTGASEIVNASINSSIKSISCDPDLGGSPKTKKQRQALKLRNAAEQNSNSNCSQISYNTNENAVPTTVNENAVLGADDLRKSSVVEANQPPQIPPSGSGLVRPLSPQSNSRSSSSSSSSSSCSNSSRSSNKSHKVKSATAISATTLEKENMHEGVIQVTAYATNSDVIDKTKTDFASTHEEKPLNLNSKTNVETSPAKSCFEEVENKLEEMFAGIEDEPVPQHHDDDEDEEHRQKSQTPANVTEVVNQLSLALELSTASTANAIESAAVIAEKIPEPPKSDVKETTTAPTPTKAAKKSTVPSPVKPVTPPASPTPFLSSKPPSPPPPLPTVTAKRITPPRRRLSVVMDPSNLRITIESSNNKKKQQQESKSKHDNGKQFIVRLDDETPSTSAAAALAAKATRETLGSETKSSTSAKKEKSQTNSRKRGVMSKSPKGGSTKASGKFGKNAKQKSQKSGRRRKQDSSDDDEDDVAAVPTRELTVAVEQKFKSPFILVKRDGSVSVINATSASGSAEDVNEKQTKVKKVPISHDRRNIRGLHSSTLSNKYDADTTDSTWICVFCKRGPHRMGLGDLFGPYLVSVDCEEYKTAIHAEDALDLDAAFVSKRRRMDMVQHNPRNLPVVPATALRAGVYKKKRKSLDEVPLQLLPINDPLDCSDEAIANETFFGMSKVSTNSYEVWLHEDCIVWAPDVFLVGARVMGLDVAVWQSTRYHCVLCGKAGAIICCLQRDCKTAAHVPCAREANWSLDATNLKVYCQRHSSTLASETLPVYS